MVLASLVSAFSYLPIGRSKKKAYLPRQKTMVLHSAAMRQALARTRTNESWYHTWKNLWPSFWEEARDQFNAEEMPSKYHSYCAVIAGACVAFPIGLIIGILI